MSGPCILVVDDNPTNLGYITKPIDTRKLSGSVAGYLGRRGLLAHV